MRKGEKLELSWDRLRYALPILIRAWPTLVRNSFRGPETTNPRLGCQRAQRRRSDGATSAMKTPSEDPPGSTPPPHRPPAPNDAATMAVLRLRAKLRGLFERFDLDEADSHASVVEVDPAVDLRSLKDGDLIRDFEIIRRHGRPSLGLRYEAVHIPSVRRVELLLFPGASPKGMERLQSAVRVVEAARSPHLPVVVASGVVLNAPFVALRGIDGRTWSERISALRAKGAGSLHGDSGAALRDDLSGVARAFTALHSYGPSASIISGDSVVVSADGLSVLSDPGFSHAARDELRTPDPRTNERHAVRALGVLLYEGLTLRSPDSIELMSIGQIWTHRLLRRFLLSAFDPRRRRPRASAGLSEVCVGALDPRHEPLRSVAEFISALERAT